MPERRSTNPFAAQDAGSNFLPGEPSPASRLTTPPVPGTSSTRTPYETPMGGGFGVPPTSLDVGPGDLVRGGSGPTIASMFGGASGLMGMMGGMGTQGYGVPPQPGAGDVAMPGADTGDAGDTGDTGDGYPITPTGPDWPQPPTPAGPGPVVATAGGAPPPPSQYAPVLGADTGKLNDPGQQSPKYRFLRLAQQYGARRGNLQATVDAYNQQYGTHAKVLSDDRVDMGEPGWPPIDLFNANGDALQWVVLGGTSGGGSPSPTNPGNPTSGPQRMNPNAAFGSSLMGGATTDATNGQRGIIDRTDSVPGDNQYGDQTGNPWHTGDPNLEYDPNAPPFGSDYYKTTTTPAGPQNQTLYDPLGSTIDDTLQRIMSTGLLPDGRKVMDVLLDIIGKGGMTPNIEGQLVGAREQSGLAQRSMLADARAALADSGTLSEPGVEQGGTNLAVERIAENIAPNYAQSVRDIYSHALDITNQSLQSALATAAGLSAQQASAVLESIGQTTNRQQMLANVAIQSLDQNRQWNQFLLQYGLDKEKLKLTAQQGNYDQLIQLLMQFLTGANTAAQGRY